MPTRDRRTVGDLLAESDALAREALLDLSADHSAGEGLGSDRGRGGPTVGGPAIGDAGATSDPDLMLRLRQVANGIAATSVSNLNLMDVTVRQLSRIWE